MIPVSLKVASPPSRVILDYWVILGEGKNCHALYSVTGAWLTIEAGGPTPWRGWRDKTFLHGAEYDVLISSWLDDLSNPTWQGWLQPELNA